MMSTQKDILSKIDLGDGYVIDEITVNDLSVLKNIIEKQYRARLTSVYPNERSVIDQTAIENYHTLDFVAHKNLWPKEVRTLSEDDVLQFKKINLFKELEQKFGPVVITNEDKTRTQEIYWRLVRPNYENDVGPLHADSWFWTLHNGSIDQGFRRLKIWISIHNQCNKNGFRLIAGSQKKTYAYKGEERDGKIKPVYDCSLESEESLILVPTNSGQYILFHDNLIHGGAVGGDKTRISLEMTLLIKE
jgi:hypothetical protein